MGEISDDCQGQIILDHEEYLEADDYRYGDGPTRFHRPQALPAVKIPPLGVYRTPGHEMFCLVYHQEELRFRSWARWPCELVGGTQLDSHCLHRLYQPFSCNTKIQGVECEHGIRIVDGQRPTGRILRVSGCRDKKCKC